MTTIWSPLPQFDKSGGQVIVTSGYRTSSRPDHYGLDLGTTDGIEVGVDLYAVEDGLICFQQPASAGAGAGHYTHLMGDSGHGWRYLHQLEDFVLPVGTRVKAGQKIGHVGNTGGVAAHLHLEKLRNVSGSSTAGWFTPGNTLDPQPDVQAAWNAGRWPGTGGGGPATPEEDDVTPQDIDAIAAKVIDRLGDKDDQGANKAREEIAFSSWFAIGGQGKAQAKPGERLAQPWLTLANLGATDSSQSALELNTFNALAELIGEAVGKQVTWDQGVPHLEG